ILRELPCHFPSSPTPLELFLRAWLSTGLNRELRHSCKYAKVGPIAQVFIQRKTSNPLELPRNQNLYPAFNSHRYTVVFSLSLSVRAEQVAQLRYRFGPSGNTIAAPSTSASRLTPSAVGGSVKFNACPKITGYDSRTFDVIASWYTSASSRNVAVSDHASADTLIFRPPCANPLESIRVNGHGPAMHEARTFSNVLSTPASSDADPVDAFHFLSGEHSIFFSHGTFPL